MLLNECETPVEQRGEGPAIVLLHGGPGACSALDGLELPAHWRQIRYAQRGSARAGRKAPLSLAQLVRDLEALRRQLELTDWIVLGHGWGAFLALAYAVEHAGVTRALALLNGSGLDTDWQKAYHLARRKRLSPADQIELLHLRQERDDACQGKRAEMQRRQLEISLSADLADPCQLPDLRERLLACPQIPAVVDKLLSDQQQLLHDAAFRARVAQLSMPVLCLQGAADPRPDTGARTLAEALAQGQFVTLPKAGHYPWLDQPALTAASLEDFLLSLA